MLTTYPQSLCAQHCLMLNLVKGFFKIKFQNNYLFSRMMTQMQIL
jgi:hypothetical protein